MKRESERDRERELEREIIASSDKRRILRFEANISIMMEIMGSLKLGV